MADLDNIIRALTQRTRDERMKWRSSAESGVFVASIGANSVVVRRTNSNSEIIEDQYRVDFLNKDGETVEVVETEHPFDWDRSTSVEDQVTDYQNENVRALYAAARRSALNTDATLNELAADLGLT